MAEEIVHPTIHELLDSFQERHDEQLEIFNQKYRNKTEEFANCRICPRPPAAVRPAVRPTDYNLINQPPPYYYGNVPYHQPNAYSHQTFAAQEYIHGTYYQPPQPYYAPQVIAAPPTVVNLYCGPYNQQYNQTPTYPTMPQIQYPPPFDNNGAYW